VLVPRDGESSAKIGVQDEVERLKRHAEEVLREHLLPRRAARDHELLRDLLLVK